MIFEEKKREEACYQVHHVGYLVADINSAVQEFEALGYKVQQQIIYDPVRLINICFIENHGVLVELIAPVEQCQIFTKLRKKIGNAPYHICYLVKGDFNVKLESLLERGYLLVQPPEPAVALGGRRVAFLMNDAIGLIEILESKDD